MLKWSSRSQGSLGAPWTLFLTQPGGGDAHKALADGSGVAVHIPSFRPQGGKLPLEGLSSGALRALNSRDCGSVGEELPALRGLRIFTWLLGKQNPLWR